MMAIWREQLERRDEIRRSDIYPVRAIEPLWIVIEGADGTGKTTLARRLQTTIQHSRYLHFPNHNGDWSLPDTISKHCSMFLYAAELVDGYHRTIMPMLYNDEVNVICDRWFMSNFVYHLGNANAEWATFLQDEGKISRMPDIVIVLDEPYHVIKDRRDDLRVMPKKTYDQIRQAYQRFNAAASISNTTLIYNKVDETQDDIYADILDKMFQRNLIEKHDGSET